MINEDRNTFLSINLDAINKNFEIIKKKVGKRCTVASTVKADAYGLGADKVVPSLIKNGCKFFFVATTNEAIQLRKINKSISIFILNGLVTTNIAVIEKYNLIPVINNLKQLEKIEKFQLLKGKKLKIALHFDTGMSRLGFDKYETEKLIKNKSRLIKKSNIYLVMSHLVNADNRKSKLNLLQLNRFIKITKHFPNTKLSLANSGGTLLGKKYHFDMVRPGISLYGGQCQIGEKIDYKNVVTLKAKLIQVREIYKNDTVGYGATYTAKSKMQIGTFALGYADGFNRLFSNNFKIYHKNKILNILGRVSMDLIIVNLSSIKNLKNIYDEEFIIIGGVNSVNKVAKLINTIPYEILTSLGKRYQRIYIS